MNNFNKIFHAVYHLADFHKGFLAFLDKKRLFKWGAI